MRGKYDSYIHVTVMRVGMYDSYIHPQSCVGSMIGYMSPNSHAWEV